jgi:hypothetical protein
MLRTEFSFMPGKRDPGHIEALPGAPAGNQGKGELTAPAMGLPVIVAEARLGSRQQILAGQDRFRPVVLVAQRYFEGLPVDDSQRDKVLADPPAEPFLARQGNLDVSFAHQTLRDQKFTEKHNVSRVLRWLHYVVALTPRVNDLDQLQES